MAAHRSSHPRAVPVLVHRHTPVDTPGSHLLGRRGAGFICNSENMSEVQIAMARESLIQRAKALVKWAAEQGFTLEETCVLLSVSSPTENVRLLERQAA